MLLSGCEPLAFVGLAPLDEPWPAATKTARVNAVIPPEQGRRAVLEDRGSVKAGGRVPRTASPAIAPGGDITFNFVDTDIREIARVILGVTLKLNYTIDPGIHGTATLETGTPLSRAALLPTLETLLNQNGATLVKRNGLYAVLPIAAAAATTAIPSGGSAEAGTEVVPLRYVQASELAKVLEPYIGEGSKLTAEPGRNALILSGDLNARHALIALIRAFDIDGLARQSFAIFPTGDSNATQVAGALEKALQAANGGPSAGLVRVIALPRVNGVLVASAQPQYLDAAKRVFRLTNRAEAAATRKWHIYYVQNGQAADFENLLQRAFTPRHVSPSTPPGGTAPGAETATLGSRDLAAPSATSTAHTGSSPAGLTDKVGAAGGLGATADSAAAALRGPAPATEPLSTEGGAAGNEPEDHIRILANRRNNALLIYATASEYAAIDTMLHKTDIIPLQVMLEATIAEVTLNDKLAYGTQFYLGNKLAGILTTGSSVTTTSGASLSPTVVSIGGIPVGLGDNFPGFVFANGAREVLNALAKVTRVRILSSPHVTVLDNDQARLQVGQQVPILTGTATSTITNNAPIVNSIDYHSTGIIMQVTPHINAGGLVTLDLSQEVSDVAAPAANTPSDSPTFDDRVVRTRVAVQDGQTVALAGLMRDHAEEGNSGIPLLKDVPVLGTLFSSQLNTRERTELLVMITPHVVHDQHEARALTEDLRRQVVNAALVPLELPHQPLSGRPNPNGF